MELELATQVQGAGGNSNDGGVIVGMTMPPDREWSEDVMKIGDSIVNLTLAQCAQLSIYLEEVHGIKCSSGVPQPRDYIPLPPKDAIPEQTEWALVYEGFDPAQKINLVKVFRELTSQGLKESMDFITNGVGKTIKEGMANGEASIFKSKLEAVGAKITLK